MSVCIRFFLVFSIRCTAKFYIVFTLRQMEDLNHEKKSSQDSTCPKNPQKSSAEQAPLVILAVPSAEVLRVVPTLPMEVKEASGDDSSTTIDPIDWTTTCVGVLGLDPKKMAVKF